MLFHLRDAGLFRRNRFLCPADHAYGNVVGTVHLFEVHGRQLNSREVVISCTSGGTFYSEMSMGFSQPLLWHSVL
ncbi:hypothetical protein MLD38_000644 [Melastoma candidum]|uniref:Uncharacterized protein n=1 Tax=Melastoma candidum TaxID=119954 RepID=A0ACB9SCP6_9MYRT|nr:hypothetical protein MLD38_000644 [Melastoma candidum]